MQPAKFSVCLGFIALCFVTVAMVTAPFIEKRRGEKGFLTRSWIFLRGLGQGRGMRTRALLLRLRPGWVLLGGLWALSVGALSPGRPPLREEYLSQGGRFRLELLSNLAVFEETKEKPGAEGGTVEITYRAKESQQLVTTQQKDAQGQLTGVRLDLRLFDSQGAALSFFDTQDGPTAPPRWTTVVGYLPQEVLISESGQYVVTFDRWQDMGRSREVVVLFGPDGQVRWRLALKDFLSEEEISRLEVSDSGLLWAYRNSSGAHRFQEADGLLVLRVMKPHWVPMLFEAEVVERRISLETGKVVP